MNEYAHCLNALGTKFALIEIQLAMNNPEKANKIYAETLEWFMKTYELKRKE